MTRATDDSSRPRPCAHGHVLHYPLNGVDLDFLRYSQPYFGPRSVIASHVFQDYLFPKRVAPRTYTDQKLLLRTQMKSCLDKLRHQDEQLYSEYVSLDHLKTRSLLWEPNLAGRLRPPLSQDKTRAAISTEDVTLDLLQRFFLENESEPLHTALAIHFEMNRIGTNRKRRPTVKQNPNLLDARHFPRPHMMRKDPRLYTGSTPQFHTAMYLDSADPNRQIAGDTRLLLRPSVQRFVKGLREYPIPPIPKWPRRERSLPPLPAYHTAVVKITHQDPSAYRTWLLSWPGLSLQELDHRTRPRSLSRRRIARMFGQEDEAQLGSRFSGGSDPSLGARCSNCLQGDHATTDCTLPCGHCDKLEHDATDCPVPKDKRCKCSPFPTFHRARGCDVQCSRPCGNPHPPGHRKHANAMTCEYRCCMCGLKGHAGIDCNLKRCRCKGRHLGQDCSWNPACRVEGCDRYLCGVHCRECGSRERPFVGWRCQGCLKNGAPVGGRADAWEQDSADVEQAREEKEALEILMNFS